MRQSQPDSGRAEELNKALRRAHRSVLGLIAVAAALIAWPMLLTIIRGENGAALTPPLATDLPRAITWVAIGLAVGTVMTRRAGTAPSASPRNRVFLALASLLLAGALAILGVAVALVYQDSQTGLTFSLGAAIFSLRPPPRLPPAGGAT